VFRFDFVASDARASRSMMRYGTSLVSVLMLGILPPRSAHAQRAASGAVLRSDIDSVAIAKSDSARAHRDVLCDVMTSFRTGCRPGLERGSVTYGALIIRPGPLLQRNHGILVPLH